MGVHKSIGVTSYLFVLGCFFLPVANGVWTVWNLRNNGINYLHLPTVPTHQLIGSLSHYLPGFIHPNGGWPWDFWTINSMMILVMTGILVATGIPGPMPNGRPGGNTCDHPENHGKTQGACVMHSPDDSAWMGTHMSSSWVWMKCLVVPQPAKKQDASRNPGIFDKLNWFFTSQPS